MKDVVPKHLSKVKTKIESLAANKGRKMFLYLPYKAATFGDGYDITWGSTLALITVRILHAENGPRFQLDLNFACALHHTSTTWSWIFGPTSNFFLSWSVLLNACPLTLQITPFIWQSFHFLALFFNSNKNLSDPWKRACHVKKSLRKYKIYQLKKLP